MATLNSTALRPAPHEIERISIPAMKLVQSSRTIRRLANLVLGLIVLTFAAMMFLPWQQTSKGAGRVTAYVPQERQQTVMSPVKGIVAHVTEGLVEGSRVKQGDVVLELQPAAANMVEQLRGQANDLRDKLQTARVKTELYEQNVRDFGDARDFAVRAAEEMVASARAKLQAKQDAVSGYTAKEWQAKLNYDRQKSLFEKGIKPEKEIEKERKDWEVARAELDAVKQEVIAAEREVEAKQSELEQKRREAQTKVDYARGMREDAVGQQSTTQKELRDVEMKLAEMERMVITAPRDGTILRMPIFERGQTIKEGSLLFTLVPDTKDLAVELWISGNDVPLIRQGDHVRLQFEGWPAVQFAGWPSVAVGTFGGTVSAIDRTDDGKGKFRILVLPESGIPWPSDRFLRQGARANGWVMLQRVRLGYEVWRQLNGFPPVVAESEPDAGDKGSDDDGDDEKKSKPKIKPPK